MATASTDHSDDTGSEPIIIHLDEPEENQVSQLRNAITLIFHAISKDRASRKRSGKPEPPVQITYRLSRPMRSDLQSPFISHPDNSSHPRTLFHLLASDFWQHRCSVTHFHAPKEVPHRMILTQHARQQSPLRPPHPPSATLLYSRYSPSLDATFSLKVASVEEHLQCFHQWHNSDRVNAFWGERGSLDHHRRYLEQHLSTHSDNAYRHVVPVIGYFNQTPFAYFELYHASEDAIAPFARAGDYDRGWHALVGDPSCRGPHRVKVWVSCVTQYLFLSDARTMRVMLEPRVDNETFIGYLTQGGYVVEKEFNFPHKRAALVSVTREKFFETQGVAT